MGNSMTYGPVPESAQVNMKFHYETNNSRKQKGNNYQLHKSNTMRDADRYSRNGSNRGNGIRSS